MRVNGSRPLRNECITVIHSFILETYVASLKDTITQRRPQPSHCQRRRTWGSCNIWNGRPSARNAAQRGVGGRSFHADGPTTEKTLRCIVAKWARGTKSSHLAAERSTRSDAKTDTWQQRSQRSDGAQRRTHLKCSKILPVSKEILEIQNPEIFSWLHGLHVYTYKGPSTRTLRAYSQTKFWLQCFFSQS